MNEFPSDPDVRLDACLRSLPRSVPLSRDLWPAIEAAMTPARAPQRHGLWALAAGLAFAALAALLSLPRGSAPVPITARVAAPQARVEARGAPETQVAQMPEYHAVHDPAAYRATQVMMRRNYQQQLTLLSRPTRQDVVVALNLIRESQRQIRGELVRHPGSAVLMQLLASTIQQEFDLYATIDRSTQQMASRTPL